MSTASQSVSLPCGQQMDCSEVSAVPHLDNIFGCRGVKTQEGRRERLSHGVECMQMGEGGGRSPVSTGDLVIHIFSVYSKDFVPFSVSIYLSQDGERGWLPILVTCAFARTHDEAFTISAQGRRRKKNILHLVQPL